MVSGFFSDSDIEWKSTGSVKYAKTALTVGAERMIQRHSRLLTLGLLALAVAAVVAWTTFPGRRSTRTSVESDRNGIAAESTEVGLAIDLREMRMNRGRPKELEEKASKNPKAEVSPPSDCVSLVSGQIASDGKVIPGAAVSLLSGDRSVSLVGHSDPGGLFAIQVTKGDRVIVEALGYDFYISGEFWPSDCDATLPFMAVELVPSGTKEVNGREYFEAETSSAVGAHDPETRGERGDFSPEAERLEISAQAAHEYPEPLVDEHGIEWLFSRPAGVYFMRMEATVPAVAACSDAGVCSPRLDPETYEAPRCTRARTGPADCMTQDNAGRFCRFIGGRLPTRSEWTAEYTNGAERRFPWGDDPPDCDRGNVALYVGDESAPGSVFGLSVCAGKRTALGCSYPKGRSVSGLCDMSGNLAEWMAPPDELLGLPAPRFRHNDLAGGGFGYRSGYVGVRCVRESNHGLSPQTVPSNADGNHERSP